MLVLPRLIYLVLICLANLFIRLLILLFLLYFFMDTCSTAVRIKNLQESNQTLPKDRILLIHLLP